MKISVLMSIYYRENKEYLDQCLSSIWDIQTIKPDEIIIIQDGVLTNELLLVIDKWKNKLGSKLKIVIIKNNVGLGKALNEGLKYCSNEWVFRMDTDDICLPERFQKQIDYIYKNPNVALLSGQVEEFDENMSYSIGIKKVPITNDEIYSSVLLRNPFNHMAVAYKKSVIEKVGGYQHHLYMEDYNLWLRVIAQKYEVYNLPDILVNVRAGSAMYARRKGFEYIKSEYQLAKLKNDLKLQPIILSYIYFIVRSFPRLLPRTLLGQIYKKLRKG